MKRDPLKIAIGFSILLLFSLAVFLPLDCYLSRGYKSYLDFIYFSGHEETKLTLLENELAAKLFVVLKVVPVLIYLWLLWSWIDFYTKQKRKTSLWTNRLTDLVCLSLKENKNFIFCLGKTGRLTFFVLFGIILVAYVCFAFWMPLSYDEWWSWRYFSSQGFWRTLCFYPLPNNHVLYNLASSFFVKLPFNEEFTVRWPAILSSLLALFLFFKVCKAYFSMGLSCLLLVVLATCYPFAVYAFQARGYSFVSFFTILLIYSSFRLVDDYKSNKYRFFLVLSIVGGHLSIPSFLYVYLTVVPVLGVQILARQKTKELLLLVKDNLIGIVFVLFGYSFIFYFNESDNLLNPNGGDTKFTWQGRDTFDEIIKHYRLIGEFFFNGCRSLFTLLGPLALLVFLLKRKSFASQQAFLCVLSIVMVWSPLLVIAVHRVYPFERTWLYLIFPTLFCWGFMIQTLIGLVRSARPYQISFSMTAVFYLVLSMTGAGLLYQFNRQYKERSVLDFEIQALRETELEPLFGTINKIAYTENGKEFHLAHIIYCMSYKAAPKQWVDAEILKTVKDQDILVLDQRNLVHYRDSLANYRFLKLLRGNICVFAKKSPGRAPGHSRD